MATALPIVKIGNKKYYVDERLNELRNVNDPGDHEKMEGSAEFYVKEFGIQKDFCSKLVEAIEDEEMDARKYEKMGEGQEGKLEWIVIHSVEKDEEKHHELLKMLKDRVCE